MTLHVFTIGYEKASFQDFLRTLHRDKITLLIDIRAIAWSRRPEFAQDNLSKSLAAQNISYRHMKALGNPAKIRDAADENQKPYPEIFLEHLATDTAQNALNEVRRLTAVAVPCLLCYERDPNRCHRSLVTATLGSDIKVIDLIPGQLI